MHQILDDQKKPTNVTSKCGINLTESNQIQVKVHPPNEDPIMDAQPVPPQPQQHQPDVIPGDMDAIREDPVYFDNINDKTDSNHDTPLTLACQGTELLIFQLICLQSNFI